MDINSSFAAYYDENALEGLDERRRTDEYLRGLLVYYTDMMSAVDCAKRYFVLQRASDESSSDEEAHAVLTEMRNISSNFHERLKKTQEYAKKLEGQESISPRDAFWLLCSLGDEKIERLFEHFLTQAMDAARFHSIKEILYRAEQVACAA